MPATPGHFARDPESLFFAKVEAAYDTVAAFVATDAMSLHSLVFEPERPRAKSKERAGGSSTKAFVRSGPLGGKWTAVGYIRLVSAGVVPRIDPLLHAAFGATGTVVGGTSVTYSISGAAPASLQLGKRIGSAIYEVANGAWVEEVKIEMTTSEFKITFSGGFASYARIFGAEVATGGASATDADVPYKLSHIHNMQVGGRVIFGALDNSGAGYLITAVDEASNPPEITVSPVLEDDVTEHDEILPWTPSQTLTGTILEFVEGGVAIDSGSEVGFVSSTTTFKTGRYGRMEASNPKPAGVLRGDRSVEQELQLVFVDKDNGTFVNSGWVDDTVDLLIRMGDTAGLRMKLDIPKLNVDITPIETPEDGTVGIATLKGTALMNSAEFDEFKITLD